VTLRVADEHVAVAGELQSFVAKLRDVVRYARVPRFVAVRALENGEDAFPFRRDLRIVLGHVRRRVRDASANADKDRVLQTGDFIGANPCAGERAALRWPSGSVSGNARDEQCRTERVPECKTDEACIRCNVDEPFGIVVRGQRDVDRPDLSKRSRVGGNGDIDMG